MSALVFRWRFPGAASLLPALVIAPGGGGGGGGLGTPIDLTAGTNGAQTISIGAYTHALAWLNGVGLDPLTDFTIASGTLTILAGANVLIGHKITVVPY